MSAAKKPKKPVHMRVPPTVTVSASGVETYRLDSVAICGVRITPSITTRDASAVTCGACRERMEARHA